MFFDVQLNDGSRLNDVVLNMPGQHNVLNALAAITVAAELGVDGEAIKRGLSEFAGIGRRVQAHGELVFTAGRALLFDDYGHHPTEIRATLQAMRGGWPDKRLVVIFQPHRYSRTRDLFEDFAEALSLPDVLLLTEVYSAGEERINGADGRSLARAIRNRGMVDPIFVADINDAPDSLECVLADGDIVLTLGAGNVGALCNALPANLTRRCCMVSQTFPAPDRYGKVAVVMGGWSAERDVSLMSGQQVFDSLITAGVNAHAVDAGRTLPGFWWKADSTAHF